MKAVRIHAYGGPRFLPMKTPRVPRLERVKYLSVFMLLLSTISIVQRVQGIWLPTFSIHSR